MARYYSDDGLWTCDSCHADVEVTMEGPIDDEGYYADAMAICPLCEAEIRHTIELEEGYFDDPDAGYDRWRDAGY
jgi:hypothetical protein